MTKKIITTALLFFSISSFAIVVSDKYLSTIEENWLSLEPADAYDFIPEDLSYETYSSPEFQAKLEEAGTKLKDSLEGADIVLAGFMKIVSQRFIDSFNSKIINLHPSLLPCFRGLNAIKQAWDAGVKITGCTVHWVSSELDGGPIIAQAPVRIMSSDTIESTTAKVQAAEHMLLPSVVADIAHTHSIAKPRD